MVEKTRMLGIVVLFLVIGAILWSLLSAPPQEDTDTAQSETPDLTQEAQTIPNFEFDEVDSAETDTTQPKIPDPLEESKANASPEIGWISGQVVSKRIRKPLRKFKLLLVSGEYSPDMDSNYRFHYPASGKFKIKATPDDQPLTLHVRAPGYKDAKIPITGVRSGETLEGIVVALESENMVTGRVIDYQGNPVEGAWVFDGIVLQKNNWEHNAIATSDAQGRIYLEGVSPGEHTFSSFSPGLLPAVVTINVNADNSDMQFMLGQGGTLEGFVTLNNNAPEAPVLIFVTISCENFFQNNTFRADTFTTENGQYRITGIPTGTGQILASLTNQESTNTKSTNTIVIEVEVRDGFTTKADVPFASGTSSIEGYIMASETETTSGKVQLKISNGSYTENWSVRVGSDGYYFFPALPPGRASLYCLDNSSIIHGGRNTRNEKLTNNEHVRWDLLMYPGTTLTCMIQNAPTGKTLSARLVSDAAQTLQQENTSEQSVAPSPRDYGPIRINDSSITFSGVESGTYTLTITASSPSSEPQTISSQIAIQGEPELELTLSF